MHHDLSPTMHGKSGSQPWINIGRRITVTTHRSLQTAHNGQPPAKFYVNQMAKGDQVQFLV
jgi:hypothetical protein